MSALCFVVEDRTDAELLRNVLPKDDLENVRFFAGQGRMSLATVARNIVVHDGDSVLVVKDADTLDPKAAEQARQLTKAVISHVAGDLPFEVFSFVPEIEVVFFEAPDCLATVVGRVVDETEVQQGLVAPNAPWPRCYIQGMAGRPTV